MIRGNKRVALLNSREFPCPGSHLLHTRKFLQTFSGLGYEYLEISNLSELRDANLNYDDMIYFSDHGLGASGPSAMQISILEEVARIGAVPIFWFWQNKADLLDEIFNGRWLLTGEHLRAKNVLPSHQEYRDLSAARSNFVPLSFAASLEPTEVGNFHRKIRFNATFVGHRYQLSLNRRLRLQVPKTKIVYTPPFISEEDRIQYFTGSHVVLGWHSEGNIQNGNVVERVFEGLAYGSVVITDNPYAIDATDGNVLFADTFAATKAHLDRVIVDEKFRSKLQREGIKWAQSFGTYKSVAESFIMSKSNL